MTTDVTAHRLLNRKPRRPHRSPASDRSGQRPTATSTRYSRIAGVRAARPLDTAHLELPASGRADG